MGESRSKTIQVPTITKLMGGQVHRYMKYMYDSRTNMASADRRVKTL